MRLQYYEKQTSLWRLLENKIRAKSLKNKDSQTCRRRLQQNEKSTSTVIQGRMLVLKRRKAAKHRHESGFEAKIQTLPIGKRSSDLSALTAAVARKVVSSVCGCTSDHDNGQRSDPQQTTGAGEYEKTASPNSFATTVSKIY
jgi:hypothetical protein